MALSGELTPEQQLTVLSRVWGNDRDGYVFIPVISGQARTAERRRHSYHEGRAYKWPTEKGAILERLQHHPNDDVYFTPALFNAKRRTEQNVEAERALWADLDPVSPESITDFRPTIAWETSPGRYQGVWLLDRPKVGASWPSKENHRLTLHLGADPSGWDSTQLLRVPGRSNHKPDYGETVPGRLLWDNGPRYQWSDFNDLPEVGVVHDDYELLDEELLEGVDRHEVWARVRLKVSRACREYMAQRSTPEGADRSEVLWQIERELADAGCSVAEIIVLIRHSAWNKYAGRQDELRRLKVEAAKAVAARSEERLEREDDEEKPEITWVTDFFHQPIAKPRWLVEGIWTVGGCGFISGAPKSYKSYLALDLAVSVASGGYWLGLKQHRVREARPVLYLQEEDGRATVKERLEYVLDARAPELSPYGLLAARTDVDPPTRGDNTRGAPRESVPPLRQSATVSWAPPPEALALATHVQTGFISSDETWQGWLEEKIREAQFGLVIIDTLGTTAGDVDTDRAGDLMLKLLRPLRTLARETETAICLVHHNRKSQPNANGARAGSEMLGSVALHAWVDCGVYARAGDRPEANGNKIINLQMEAKDGPPGLEMRLEIPRMFADVRTGQRQLWGPEVVVTNDEQHKEEPPAEPKKGHTGGSRSDASWKAKLRGLGLHTKLRSIADVRGVLGNSLYGRLCGDGTLTVDEGSVRWNL